jgi:hypothetical protein
MNDTQSTPVVRAKGRLGDHDIDAIVLNPGGWFGRTWLLEIGGSYTPLFLVVEAGSVEDAIEELSDSEKYGHLIHVPDSDLADYPEDSRHYDGSGRVIDLDWVGIHGDEGTSRTSGQPFRCTYYGDGLPAEGIAPPVYEDYLAWIEEDPRKHHKED